MSKEKTETTIFIHRDKDKANELRSAIIQNFARTWVYVLKVGSKYEVSVASQWGGKLPKDELDILRSFVKGFKNEK